MDIHLISLPTLIQLLLVVAIDAHASTLTCGGAENPNPTGKWSGTLKILANPAPCKGQSPQLHIVHEVTAECDEALGKVSVRVRDQEGRKFYQEQYSAAPFEFSSLLEAKPILNEWTPGRIAYRITGDTAQVEVLIEKKVGDAVCSTTYQGTANR